MKTLAFTKMAGAGNDFIILDNRKLLLDNVTLIKLAQRVCTRRVSLGADGILMVEESSIADFKMRLFNKDGSEGEMCGNGARCIARFAYEEGIASEKMTFETLAGIIRGEVSGTQVKIGMGNVAIKDIQQGQITTSMGELSYHYFILGVPHTVVFVDCDQFTQDFALSVGRELRHRTDVFPKGTNVNFVRQDGSAIKVLTYERGVEEVTLACGTGSSASAIVANLERGFAYPVDVVTLGGPLKVYFQALEGDYTDIYLEGASNIIAKGNLYEESWS